MRRLLSASFRNRLFAALLAASLIPLLLCSALLLQIFRLRMEDRAQGEADGYLDSVGQTLDQACRSFSSAAAALERDGVLSQALLQGSPSQGEVYRLFLEDVQSAQALARLIQTCPLSQEEAREKAREDVAIQQKEQIGDAKITAQEETVEVRDGVLYYRVDVDCEENIGVESEVFLQS